MRPEPPQQQQWKSGAAVGDLTLGSERFSSHTSLGKGEAAEAGAETSPTPSSRGLGLPTAAPPKLLFYVILCYVILFYLFYFILYYLILFYLFYFIYFILPYFTLIYLTFFYFTIYFILF